MICTLDENDYCERHKTYHVGRLKDLALMDNELGEKYRRLWDRQAGLITEEQAEAEKKRPIQPRQPCNCGGQPGRRQLH